MAVFKELVLLNKDQLFVVKRSNESNYPYHSHNEYELILTYNSSGIRFVGNNISEFKDFSLVLLGPNLPHKWKFTKIKKDSVLLVLQFNKFLFENEIFRFFSKTDCTKFLSEASRGISYNNIEVIDDIKKLMLSLHHSDGLKSLAEFYTLIDILQKEKNNTVISGKNYEKKILKKKANDMIDNVYDYLLNNYQSEIKLDDLANKYHLSKPGFCISFKKHSGKTFSEFLNELRLSQCCKLLIESDLNITEICFSNGFNNISYFNRRFTQYYGMTPSKYRKLYK